MRRSVDHFKRAAHGPIFRNARFGGFSHVVVDEYPTSLSHEGRGKRYIRL
jgi:hypothetical protein